MGIESLILLGIGLFVLSGVTKRYQDKKLAEAKAASQLKLESQRFEKIREILTDGVIEGSPKALDALKPMVEIMAEQMKGPEIIERMRLEHEQELEKINALNEPVRLFMQRVARAQGCELIDSTERELKALSEATSKVFPKLGLPAAAASEELRLPSKE